MRGCRHILGNAATLTNAACVRASLLLVLSLALSPTLFAQSAGNIPPREKQELTADQAMTASTLTRSQLDAFSNRAAQALNELQEYVTFALNPEVDSTLRAHAQRLIMAQLHPDFSLRAGKHVYQAEDLSATFPQYLAALSFTESIPTSALRWKRSWQQDTPKEFLRTAGIEIPFIWLGRQYEAQQATFSLRLLKKQFGSRTLTTWEVQLQEIVVEEKP